MNRVLLVISLCIFMDLPVAAQELPENAGRISGFSIYQTLDRLASEEFRGRHTGDRGFTDAAAWAAEMFEEWGLAPASEKSGYLLPFTIQ